jgi:intein-encoded DNA endonuclease-like protein
MGQGQRISSRHIRSILSLYEEGFTFESIGDCVGVTASTVHKYLHKQGVEIKKRTRTSDWRSLKDSNAISRYQNGESSNHIAQTLNMSKGKVQKYLRNNGITLRDISECQRMYSMNHEFFNSIETESQAYWLGFITADGCVSHSHTLSIVLAIKDRDHIIKFSRAIESNHPIKDRLKDKYPTTGLQCNSLPMSISLERFGIHQNKGETVAWPSLPSELYRHYLRGLSDGDGSFSIAKKINQILFGLISSPSLINSCRVSLIDTIGISMHIDVPKRSPRMRVLRCAGNRKLFPFVNYLYEDATVFLTRKRDIVLNHYRSLPKYRDQLRFG